MQKEKKLKSAFHTGVTKVTLQGQQTAFLWNERQCKLNVATRKSAGIKRKENKNHFLKMQQTEAVSDFLHVTLLMLACFHIIGSQCPETMCLCLEDVLMCCGNTHSCWRSLNIYVKCWFEFWYEKDPTCQLRWRSSKYHFKFSHMDKPSKPSLMHLFIRSLRECG